MICYSTDEGFTFIAYDAEEIRLLSSETKAAVLTLGCCSKCHSNLNPETLCCATSPGVKNHDSIRFSEENFLSFEPFISLEAKRNKYRERSVRRKDAMQNVAGFYEKQDLNEIWSKQNKTCYYCGEVPTNLKVRNSFYIDHMTAVSSGGTEWPLNIALTCYECNRNKSDFSALSFWTHLRKERGVRWVNERQRCCKVVDDLKKQLTKKRKSDLNEMTVALQSKLVNGIKERKIAHQAISIPSVFVSVECTKDGLRITTDTSTVLLPPSSHRRMKTLLKSDWKELLDAILRLEKAMGVSGA